MHQCAICGLWSVPADLQMEAVSVDKDAYMSLASTFGDGVCLSSHTHDACRARLGELVGAQFLGSVTCAFLAPAAASYVNSFSAHSSLIPPTHKLCREDLAAVVDAFQRR